MGDPRFAQVFPGLLSDRELIFYSGLAFTNLRYLHLVLYTRRGDRLRPLTISRYLLYLLYAPTYRMGPFVVYDRFSDEVDSARARRSWHEVRRGLGEVLVGVLIFEAVVKTVDAWFFKRFAPDDGSYWYSGFFEQPPDSWWLTLLGVYLTALRCYLLVKAYSHVARGLSRTVGIDLPRNMDWPILSANVLEFWRRYHVTVSGYARRHVLAPVGESAGSAGVAVLATFLFMAFWHQPALHSLVWALLQVVAIGIVIMWRKASAVEGPARQIHRLITASGQARVQHSADPRVHRSYGSDFARHTVRRGAPR